MKVQIKKLADGGGFATFTPIIKSAPAPNSASAASTSAAPESSSIIDEKMLEFLYKTGGLVNDVNQLVSDLVKLERSSNMPYMQSSNRGSSLQMIGKINEINQNKKY
ncbi:MAG: hypothetical protein ACOH2V_01230 [Candidatus Saccharimonadaceae bacterium]